MPQLILGFVGPLAAGKGTCCQYLKERYGADAYRFSTILRDILDRLYLPHIRDHLQQISLALRSTFRDDILSSTMAQDIQAATGELVTVDGIRRLTDITCIRPLPGFYLVAITADERTRYERIIQRRENADDQHKTFADFVRDGQRESERQIAAVETAADFHINNNGTMGALYRQLDTLMQKLRSSSSLGVGMDS